MRDDLDHKGSNMNRDSELIPRTPAERISAKVIFWGHFMPYDSADQDGMKAARHWGYRNEVTLLISRWAF